MKRLQLLPELLSRGPVHVALDGTGVHSVDRGPLNELSRPCPRHGLQRSLRSAVQGVRLEAHARSNGGDVDDAAREVVWQVRQDCLRDHDGGQDIDSVNAVKFFGWNLVLGIVTPDASIIDEDVDAEGAIGSGEVGFGHLDDSLACFLRLDQVRLKRDDLDAVL